MFMAQTEKKTINKDSVRLRLCGIPELMCFIRPHSSPAQEDARGCTSVVMATRVEIWVLLLAKVDARFLCWDREADECAMFGGGRLGRRTLTTDLSCTGMQRWCNPRPASGTSRLSSNGKSEFPHWQTSPPAGTRINTPGLNELLALTNVTSSFTRGLKMLRADLCREEKHFSQVLQDEKFCLQSSVWVIFESKKCKVMMLEVSTC